MTEPVFLKTMRPVLLVGVVVGATISVCAFTGVVGGGGWVGVLGALMAALAASAVVTPARARERSMRVSPIGKAFVLLAVAVVFGLLTGHTLIGVAVGVWAAAAFIGGRRLGRRASGR
jgi:hypothetical protein